MEKYRPPGTYINYYHICHRELWLHANGIRMEHTSQLVEDGKLIHETSYRDRNQEFQEVQVGRIKIDYFDRRTRTVHETKRSNSVVKAQKWQLKYYLWVLEEIGVEDITGKLEYPRQRKTEDILLTEQDRNYLEDLMPKIKDLVNREQPPEATKINFCDTCSYHDFCWCREPSENTEEDIVS